MKDIETINTYLTFTIANELFAINTSQVQSIQEMVGITVVPHSHAYMMGVINLRGKVISIIDTHIKLGLEPIEISQKTCIIVVEMQYINEVIEFGIVVDSVESVHDFSISQIMLPPSVSGSNKNEYITGMVEFNKKFIMILDVQHLFVPEDSLV